ncbi:MAG: ABC transporter substrate-binding protein [Muribaculaceae bacterium]|nr:ABC transporter substrate-binding protein [Roseburia sp.]MCM1432263.1 ABC transporter substrate-binding protein [Muribaculaceae bacterium]MCM1493998.1 ABC transporter substrate-binding protein [Muribaculaceae bacterium]MCM1561059.1 ABC transporter substrate-binding protein [Butyrivibrio sp.]
MRKRMMALAMVLALAASLAACGTKANDGDKGNTAGTEQGSKANAGETYKVGIVNYVDDASLNQIVANIETQLDAKGEELGVTFEYEPYYENAQADSAVLNQIAADLVADNVDVIVAIATPVAMVMQSATEDTDIPVVFSAVSDPVGAGLVAAMDAPGGNVTGTSDALDTNTIMNLMKAADNDVALVGLLYDTAQDSSTQAIADAKAWCEANGVAYEEKMGSTTDDVILATQSLIADGVDAVFTPSDNTIMTAELSIYELLAEAGIPHYTGADSFALNGAFCGYGVDYANLGVVTADMVVEVLTAGTDVADMPVKTFDNGIVTVNTEICEQLGFDLDTVKSAFEPLCTQFKEITTAEEFE